MTAAIISPVVLRWARERAHLDYESLAKSAKVKPEKILLWEEGKERPTFRQAQQIAKKLYIPFGYLFLPQPPEQKLPIPDLRTVGSGITTEFSADIYDLITDAQRKQDWYRDYLLERGAEPFPYIGKYDTNSDPKQIASDITKTLGPEISEIKTPKRQDQFLNYLTEKAEDAGIVVMRSGIVCNNTHRPLEVYEFRGFAICDDIAPVIFINGNDAKAAQTFTLIHELAHLWIGQSGISDISLENQINNKKQNTEKLCNTVAAEVLVPENKFSEKWKVTDSLEDNAFRLAEYFRVSNVVIARRAFDLGLIERFEYSKYYNNQKQLWQEKKTETKRGGNYYRTIPVRNGRKFTDSVIRSTFEQSLLLRDAGRLLNINPSKISRLAEERNIG